MLVEKEIKLLQDTLMENDSYLPWHIREVPTLTKKANLTASIGDAEALRNGLDRSIGEEDNGWTGIAGDWVAYSFEDVVNISELRFVFDSNLNRGIHNMPCRYRLEEKSFHVPETLIKEFIIEVQDANGIWTELMHIQNNYQRLVKLPTNVQANAIRIKPISTWGAETFHILSWDVK